MPYQFLPNWLTDPLIWEKWTMKENMCEINLKHIDKMMWNWVWDNKQALDKTELGKGKEG